MKYFPYPITGAALANCLGVSTPEVFENAFAGREMFGTSGEVFSGLPFEVPVGVLRAPPPRDEAFPWVGAETRVFRVAHASVLQIREATARAVSRWGSDRVSYVFASSTGGLEHTEEAVQNGEVVPLGKDTATSKLLFDHSMHATNDDVANFLGIGGFRYVTTTACSSSLKAVKSAVRLLASGLADAVLVGCADSLCRTTLYGFRSLGILPDAPTRPFAAERAGLTLGEGSAYVLLERDAPVTQTLAWLTGLGESSDAYHPSSPDPKGEGALASMREALRYAGVAPTQVGHVAAHGTGTLQNDAMEGLAIGALLPGIPVTATKSLTGHTLGAAGLTSLVLSIESLRRQRCFPTLRATPQDPAISLPLVRTPTEHPMDHLMVNAFAFGGSNCSALLSRRV